MHQRQPRRLIFISAFTVALFGFGPKASHAQGQCGAEFQAAGAPAGTTLCQTAVNGKCAFPLTLCANQGTSCTPQDLKTKKIKAKGHCGPVGKLNVRANGTSAVCGTATTVTIRRRKVNEPVGSFSDIADASVFSFQ